MPCEVVICTFNPKAHVLSRVLDGLRHQTLPRSDWNLTVIDNGSEVPLANSVDLLWHPCARILQEKKVGLTNARIRAAAEVTSELVIFSDDDTILDPNYLARALMLFKRHSGLGVAGGPSFPEYEMPPASWFSPDLAPLGCRNLGAEEQLESWADGQPRVYPRCSPIGAGMVIRSEIFKKWASLVATDPRRLQLGRIGTALSSGEDNDMNMVALGDGWSVGYFPELKLTHLIAARRLEASYLERLAFASSRDWISVLALHGACPWSPILAWTVPLRKAKAWFRNQAWRGPAERIRWRGACGQFVGQSRIPFVTS
jgi:glycosyltransferase involved in cell wall biosynthesis